MHYLIYLPDATPQTWEQRMRQAGLADHLGGHDTLAGVPGPQCEIGVRVAWLSVGELMNYEPHRQTWLPSIAKDESGEPLYWSGVYNDKPPQENELRRKYTQAGNFVKLGPQKWKLPTPDSVDSRAQLQDDGSYKWEVIREFSWMCDERQQLVDTYLTEGGLRELVFRAEPSSQINWLLKLLRVNYRLTPEVASHLELWVGKDHLLDTFLSTLGLVRKAASDG